MDLYISYAAHYRPQKKEKDNTFSLRIPTKGVGLQLSSAWRVGSYHNISWTGPSVRRLRKDVGKGEPPSPMRAWSGWIEIRENKSSL
eukprot:1197998-Amorphochlora_amoeboformis.AAC.2